jgi:predicted nucleotide-binding protein
MTVEQMRRGIARLKDRIGELRAFDVAAMITETPPEIAALETAIERTLVKIFGENTADAGRYLPASNIQWHAGYAMGDYPQFGHYREGIKKNIGRSIALLEQAIKTLEEEIEDASRDAGEARPTADSVQSGGRRVFIGHGGSLIWKDLKDFIQDRLKLPWEEFNRVPAAGLTTTARLSEMLDTAGMAFLVMTGEDERADGALLARMNVVHEAGLFQGRLGFKRAIVLLEQGCEEFSNIHGLGQLRFPKGNIASIFEKIREVLEREGLLNT